MNRFLQIANREIKNLKHRHERLYETEDVSVYINWGRDGKENLQLYTVIKSLPLSIIRLIEIDQKIREKRNRITE